MKKASITLFPLLLLALSWATGTGGQPSEGPEHPPNILWVIAEDLGPELGCYGHPEVRTPHLDRLASEGVRFDRAYTTAPVCSPSRSALMTGMYQTSIGAHNHRSHRDDGFGLPPGVRLLTDYFRNAGYLTANIVQLVEDSEESFFKGTGKTDWNFHYEGDPFDSDRFSDLACRQPFFAQINFSETHRGHSWDTAHTRIEQTADPDAVKIPPYYPDHPATRKVWAQYLNSVMALDRKVGVVLDRLRSEGLLEKTVVFFFGDNGRAMVRSKQWPYESGLHVPLIVRWPSEYPLPEGFPTTSTSGRLIASIDLSATSLALAGIHPPLLMQGRVLWGEGAAPPRQYVFGGRDRGDETVDRIRTVRDARYRYLRNYYPERPFFQMNRYKEWTYPVIGLMRRLHEEGKLDAVQGRLMAPTRPVEELYDLEVDPYEINNLAESPSHQKILGRLRAALDAWIMETNDQGRFPEPPEIPVYWEEQMKEIYDSQPKKTVDP